MDAWLNLKTTGWPEKRKSVTEPNQNVKKTNNLKFQRGWLDEFNWLRFDKHKAVMHCALCQDANLIPSSSNKSRVNAFATGSKDSFDLDELVEEACSNFNEKVERHNSKTQLSL